MFVVIKDKVRAIADLFAVSVAELGAEAFFKLRNLFRQTPTSGSFSARFLCVCVELSLVDSASP